MGGAAGGISKIVKKIKKVDPLRGGDKLLEKIGLPTVTGEGGKSLFGGAAPEAQEGAQLTPVGTPTTDEARQAAEQSNIQRRRRGRASTILTSGQGDTSTVNVGTKTLLG